METFKWGASFVPSKQTPLIQFIRRIANVAGAGAMGDGLLLRSFVTERDEAAFTELVRRHGPLVLSVCRHVLGNEHDAEDAFQATFLVLVRKANSIARQESVGSWLHGVAFRIASKAKV